MATALDALFLSNAKASQPLLNALLHANGPALAQDLDALSGEIHASTVTAAFEDSGLARQAILDRLNEPVAPPALGTASTTTGAYAADLPSGKGPHRAPVAVSLYQPRMFDFWGQGFGDWGHVNERRERRRDLALDRRLRARRRCLGERLPGRRLALRPRGRLHQRPHHREPAPLLRRRSRASSAAPMRGELRGGATCAPARFTPRTPPRRRGR